MAFNVNNRRIEVMEKDKIEVELSVVDGVLAMKVVNMPITNPIIPGGDPIAKLDGPRLYSKCSTAIGLDHIGDNICSNIYLRGCDGDDHKVAYRKFDSSDKALKFAVRINAVIELANSILIIPKGYRIVTKEEIVENCKPICAKLSINYSDPGIKTEWSNAVVGRSWARDVNCTYIVPKYFSFNATLMVNGVKYYQDDVAYVMEAFVQ